MKKLLPLFILMISSFSYANTGWFDDFLTVNGSSFWIGGDPGSGTQLDGHNFGSLLSLVISSADMKYWSDTQDRTGGAFYWQVKDENNNDIVGFNFNEVIWTQIYSGGNDFQGVWSGSINVLAGLSAGTTYKLHVWAKSWGTGQGDQYLSNGGADYVATFTTDAGLPVELTTFTALAKEKELQLLWETATEVNNYGFEIERHASTSFSVTDQSIPSGDEGWEKIGFIEGHGNSNSPKSYSYTDNKITAGKYQYRLKQIDIDGKFEYSNIIEVNIEAPNKFELSQNYPNPFNPTTNISFSLNETSNVSLTVFNVIGEKVMDLINQKMEAGKHTAKFDATKFNSGIYVYKLQTEKNTMTKKMLLLK